MEYDTSRFDESPHACKLTLSLFASDHKNHGKGSVVSHVIASPRDIGTPLRIRVKKGGYLDQWYLNKVTVQPGFPPGIGQ